MSWLSLTAELRELGEGSQTRMFGSSEEHAAKAHSRVGMLLKGKYRIDRVLGVGGMASVYAATHRNGRRVAVKVLHAVVSLNAEMRRRFLREGHAANAVNHPGAVVVIDDDVAEDGSAFLVMELLEGQVIERLWQQGGYCLPADVVIAIAYEICGVLQAAHKAGIVHRDIKPANLFLTAEGQLKVLDFGLARLRDGHHHTKVTANGMVFGTPAFMAPEQASGRFSQVDPQSDIWAVGATMFTLLSGMTVHQGQTVQDVLVLAATKPARSLASVLPIVDPRVANLVDRALSLKKNERWPSAEAMRSALSATNLAIYGDAVPKLKTPDELPNLRKGRSSDFSIADLSHDSGDHSDDDVPSETDVGIPNLNSAIASIPNLDASSLSSIVNLSPESTEDLDSDHEDATRVEMQSAGAIPIAAPIPVGAPVPDFDDGTDTKSDAPTALFRRTPSQPILPPIRPPPKPRAVPVEPPPPSDAPDEGPDGETLLHRPQAAVRRPVIQPAPQPMRAESPVGDRPGQSKPSLPSIPDKEIGPSPALYESTATVTAPTVTDKVNMPLAIARGVLTSLRHDGVGPTFRAHPTATLVLFIVATVTLLLIAGLVLALVR
jgi:serine/threonine protein kinase